MSQSLDSEQKCWTMPEWMEPFRGYINNTGGDTVENLMNDESANAFNNVIRAGLCVAVSSQIGLLISLHNNGLLADCVNDRIAALEAERDELRREVERLRKYLNAFVHPTAFDCRGYPTHQEYELRNEAREYMAALQPGGRET